MIELKSVSKISGLAEWWDEKDILLLSRSSTVVPLTYIVLFLEQDKFLIAGLF